MPISRVFEPPSLGWQHACVFYEALQICLAQQSSITQLAQKPVSKYKYSEHPLDSKLKLQGRVQNKSVG